MRSGTVSRAAVLTLVLILLACARADATPITWQASFGGGDLLLFHRRVFGLTSSAVDARHGARLPPGVAGLPPEFQAAWILEDLSWSDLSRFESRLTADSVSLSYLAGAVMTCVGVTAADLESCVGAWQASAIHGTKGWLLVVVPEPSGSIGCGAVLAEAPCGGEAPDSPSPPPVPEPGTIVLVSLSAGFLATRLIARRQRR